MDINNLLEEIKSEKDQVKIKEKVLELANIIEDDDIDIADVTAIYKFLGLNVDTLEDNCKLIEDCSCVVRNDNEYHLSENQINKLKSYNDAGLLALYTPMIYAIARVYGVYKSNIANDLEQLTFIFSIFKCAYIYKYLYDIIIDINKLEPILDSEEVISELQSIYSICEKCKDDEYVDIFDKIREVYNDLIDISSRVENISEISSNILTVSPSRVVYDEEDLDDWLNNEYINDETIDKAIDSLGKLKEVMKSYKKEE